MRANREIKPIREVKTNRKSKKSLTLDLPSLSDDFVSHLGGKTLKDFWFLSHVIYSFQTELPCYMTLGCAMCERNSIIADDTLISQSDDTVIYT